MASVFITALVAHFAAQGAVPPPARPRPEDVRCYRLMAALAQDEDPRIASAGLTGAQYFLGRIDARAPGFDPAADAGAAPAGDQTTLLGLCGTLMGASGRDFRTLGRQLAERQRPVV